VADPDFLHREPCKNFLYILKLFNLVSMETGSFAFPKRLCACPKITVKRSIRQIQLCVACACPCCCRALCARYNITNIRCYWSINKNIFPRYLEMHGYVILPPPPPPMLPSAHPWNSRFLGKIFLYNDHNGIDAIKEITKLSII
jgi:hypothetical protein